MSDSGRFRVVAAGEPPPRRRGPGPAVLVVGAYAILFAAGLALLWTEMRRARPPSSSAAPPPSAAPVSDPAPPDRRALLAGTGLEAEPRAAYLERLAIECCDCGCNRTLAECLAQDETCSRSAALAEECWKRYR